MKCEQAKERFADWLAAHGAGDPELAAHLSKCDACRAESEAMKRIWETMPQIPAPGPGPETRWRFYQMLEAYEQGRKEASGAGWAWWPRRPALQLGLSAAMLVTGLAAGQWWRSARPAGADIQHLRAEVQNMRQLVALSLLQQQSATERLRGVTWSYRVDHPDTEVLGALLRTVGQDPSVDVRLAAVDALAKFTASPVARAGIAQAVAKQPSPLVQVALLDLIGAIRDREAAAPVRMLAASPSADENVRRRAALVLKDLE